MKWFALVTACVSALIGLTHLVLAATGKGDFFQQMVYSNFCVLFACVWYLISLKD